MNNFSNDIFGNWQGKISVSGIELKISAQFLKDKSSRLVGSMDIISQGAKDIGLDQLVLDDNNVSFKLKGITGDPSFEGKIEGQQITGKYSQSSVFGTFELARGKAVVELRPQTPKPPFDYLIEELQFKGETDLLSGTLTHPKSKEIPPLVILVSGSGPQDRDETILNHKPFAVLADFLTKSGIAVFRYDDRGVARSKGDFSKANTLNFANDARGAVNYFLKRKDIDTQNIGMIGHSEGASIVSMLAADLEPKLSFIVMMAGMGVNGHKVLSFQRKQLHINKGVDLKIHYGNEKIFDGALPLIQSSASEADFVKSLTPMTLDYTAIFKKEFGQDMDAKNYLQSIYVALANPWMKFFLTFEPSKYLKKVKIPVLVMNGTLDQQVDIDLNLPSIKESFKEANNSHVQYELIDGVNHLFQTAKTGAVSEYSTIEETISPKVLAILKKWILKQTK
ncbi:MAG: alpha/beta fold hydrolase [Candidatus Cloacimonetes bacterium]|nr:alpha/beta fold hydrolase [Candidatus Cloacimonadota bacterium]